MKKEGIHIVLFWYNYNYTYLIYEGLEYGTKSCQTLLHIRMSTLVF